MELADDTLVRKRDWDPSYLATIFQEDFFKFKGLWNNSMADQDLVAAVEAIERYTPVIEDISLDDDTLYQAVEEIEVEYKRSQLETVQYFQFDKEGNMYIYDAGAGCTGTPRLVRLGDELIFGGYSSQPHLDIKMEPKEERPLQATCPTPRTFHHPLSEDTLHAMSHRKFSPETNKKICWVIRMYQQWRAYRIELGLEGIPCDLTDRATITPESLVYAVCWFVTEVRKVDGSDFLGKTLYDLVICIQFYLETMGLHWRIINDEAFRDIKFMLDNMMKQHTAEGVGLSVRKAQTLTPTDEDPLWSMGLLGTSLPVQLLNTVVFIIGKGFALRAGKEHRALRGLPFKSQFAFMKDSDGEVFLQYSEDPGLKNNKGSIKQRRLVPKTVDLYVMDDADHCPLGIILKYLGLLPHDCTCRAFYLQPRQKHFGHSWYLNRPVGVNKLRDVVKTLCDKAGLPGFYSNHSLRATACTKLYHNNIDEQLIQEISGHRSLAVRSYKRTCN